MNEKIAITAGILTGGRSIRMGQNKACMKWKGQTFLERSALLFKTFDEVLVSVDDIELYKDQGYVLVEDVRKGYGPLEGLYRLLSAASHSWVFLVAVDMPLLPRELILRMAEAAKDGAKAVILEGNKRIQPLCGMYHKAAIPVLEQMFQEEMHSMSELLKRMNVKIMQIEQLGFSSDVLSNINTPKDYEALKQGEKMNRKPCVLSVCGWKNAGKTTLIEKIVADLSKKGYSVGYVKHDGHEFDADVSGTDSYRIRKAGASATAVFSNSQYMIVEKNHVDIEDLIRKFSNYDLVLIEGGKDTDLPKFEIVREVIAESADSNPINRLGIITDIPDFSSRDERIYSLNNTDEIIESCIAYIEKYRQRIASYTGGIYE